MQALITPASLASCPIAALADVMNGIATWGLMSLAGRPAGGASSHTCSKAIA